MSKSQWTVAEAKAKFSEALDRARSRGPQTTTRNGLLTAVIVSAEKWERKTRRVGNLGEFFAAARFTIAAGSGAECTSRDRPVSFLLDATVVSEWMKPLPNLSAIRWLAEVDEDRVYLAMMTLAKLRFDTERLASGARKSRLETWLREELPLRFEGRLLMIETAIADAWGRLTSRCSGFGKPIGVMDAFFPATAEVHALTLVSRNVSDFTASGIPLLNPWS